MDPCAPVAVMTDAKEAKQTTAAAAALPRVRVKMSPRRWFYFIAGGENGFTLLQPAIDWLLERKSKWSERDRALLSSMEQKNDWTITGDCDETNSASVRLRTSELLVECLLALPCTSVTLKFPDQYVAVCRVPRWWKPYAEFETADDKHGTVLCNFDRDKCFDAYLRDLERQGGTVKLSTIRAAFNKTRAPKAHEVLAVARKAKLGKEQLYYVVVQISPAAPKEFFYYIQEGDTVERTATDQDQIRLLRRRYVDAADPKQ